MKWIAFLCMTTLLQAQDWIHRGGDSAYAPEVYLVGLGSSEDSFEEASLNAQAEVQRQIQVHLRSALKQELSSAGIQGEQNAYAQVESKSSSWTAGSLEGVEVVKRAKQGSHYYALAVLDKKKHRERLNVRLQRRVDSVNFLLEGAQKSVQIGEYGKALDWLDLAGKDLDTWSLDDAELGVFGVDPSPLENVRSSLNALLEKIFSVQMQMESSETGFRVKLKPEVGVPMVLNVDQKRSSVELKPGNFVPFARFDLEPGMHGFELQLGGRDYGHLNPKIRWNQKIENPWPLCLLSSNNTQFNLKLNKWNFKSISPYNIKIKLKTSLTESIDSDYKSTPQKYLVQIWIQGKGSSEIHIQKSVIASQASMAEEKAIGQIPWDEMREFLALQCSE